MATMNTQTFHPQLHNIKIRAEKSNLTNSCILDKNEHPTDSHKLLKTEVLKILEAKAWNRYPQSNHSNLEVLIANYCGAKPEQIAMGPGAASLITNLLNYFAINRFKLVIPQPTYSFFYYHCQTYNIPFIPWELDKLMQYDPGLLPVLDERSVLFIISPNNPVGNCIKPNDLELLLLSYPKTLIILDAVYQEFGNEDYTPLINQYPNLIIIRSFSKAFPAAGTRLGYLLAQNHQIEQLKKLILPYSINHFGLAYAEVLLSHKDLLHSEKKKVLEIIERREYYYSLLQSQYKSSQLKIYPSSGNFLLIQFATNELFTKVLNQLKMDKIQILDTSNLFNLENSIRVTIGSLEECQKFYQSLTLTMQ